MQNDVTGRISSSKDLRVYKLAFEIQQEIFETSKRFQRRSDMLLLISYGDRRDQWEQT
jgi:hypothetical protein